MSLSTIKKENEVKASKSEFDYWMGWILKNNRHAEESEKYDWTEI